LKYVDVNVFVYWFTNPEEFGETATRIIERIERGERAITSALTIWLLHIILSEITENYNPSEMLRRINLLRGLRIVPLTKEIIQEAINAANEYNLDLEDAIHLVTAMRYGAREIYSNDADFDRTPLIRVFE